MVKRFFLCFITILFIGKFSCIYAQQHELVKLWETDSVFKVPESVLYDAASGILYVSNIDGTDPWGKDGKGSVGKMNADGKNITVDWVSGLHAPKGMGLFNGKLYVADLTELVVIDVASAKIEKRIPVPGADRLNDVSIGGRGVIFVSDSRGRKIYRIRDEQAEVLLDSNSLRGPNGVLRLRGNVYILDAGSLIKLDNENKIMRITEGLDGGTDGIENVTGDEFIVSCWAGVIWYVHADGTKEKLLDTREERKNAADIGFDAKNKIIFVPTFWRNTVVAYQVK